MFARAAIRIAASRPFAAPARDIKRSIQVQQVKKFHVSPTLHQQQQGKCPNCGQLLPSALPACTNCWNLFSFPKDISHHELLGLPEGSNPFVVDIPTLKKRFRQAQSVCHPDSWASKNPDKVEVAQSLSARVNHAYQTLLNPLPRIEYILETHRVPLAETDKAEDMGFMMEIMDAREAIDDAEEASEVQGILEQNSAEISQTISELESLVQGKEWNAAKSGAIRLRYLLGIEKAAKKWLDNH
ncbi:hypothetical protein BKA70DRAFT_1252010 [Coprinopsis sp. MPI-PUGE-AT-0042]|nr:hypothetical protein BKA70DRAFT_1252010 [Coprinopsis sp. MPI-PUGE-AT-0042]